MVDDGEDNFIDNDYAPVDLNVVDIIDGQTSSVKAARKQKAMKVEYHLEKLNKSYALAVCSNEAFIIKTDAKPIKYLSANTFLLLQKNNFIRQGGQQAHLKLGPLWLSWENRRFYEDIVFYPGDTSDRNVFNLWQGFPYEPRQDTTCDLFLDHLLVNICSGNKIYYDWMLDWMADAIQKPYRKNWTAVLLESQEEGTGKGIFIRQFGKLFGEHFAAFNKPDQLVGKFNSHLEDKIMLFLDEGSLVDKAASNFVWSLISEPTIWIEPKNRSSREIYSYHRLMVASNDQQILRSTMHDRRWMVLRVSAHCKNNLKYFSELEEQMRCGGYEALMYLLVNRKYDEHSVKTTIKTEALNKQILNNISPLLDWWRSVLFEGRIGPGGWPVEVSTTDFYSSYIKWCDLMKINARISPYSLVKRLNHESGLNIKSFPAGPHRVYEIPTLKDCREALQEKLGYEINWDA